MAASSEKSRKASVNSDLDTRSAAVNRDMVSDAGPSEFSTRALDTAEYLADLSREMARMARDAKLDLLASILEIARLEAQTAWKRLSAQSHQA